MQQVRSRRELYSEATRAALLDEATRLFATRGYAGTSLEDVAVEDSIRAAAPLLLRKQTEPGLQRILRIIEPAGKLRFPSRVGDTGQALLRAWLDSGPEPAPALQQPVREVLLRWLGDPRLRPQRWAALGEQEIALMRRWLTRASLDLFFRLIDQHAIEEHWRYRHAFWLAYLRKGAIADAWLALGPPGARLGGSNTRAGRGLWAAAWAGCYR